MVLFIHIISTEPHLTKSEHKNKKYSQNLNKGFKETINTLQPINRTISNVTVYLFKAAKVVLKLYTVLLIYIGFICQFSEIVT